MSLGTLSSTCSFQEGFASYSTSSNVPTHSETLPVQFAVLADDGKVVVKLIDYVASCTTSVAAVMDDSAYGDGERPDIHCKFVNDAGKEATVNQIGCLVKVRCTGTRDSVQPSRQDAL